MMTGQLSLWNLDTETIGHWCKVQSVFKDTKIHCSLQLQGFIPKDVCYKKMDCSGGYIKLKTFQCFFDGYILKLKDFPPLVKRYIPQPQKDLRISSPLPFLLVVYIYIYTSFTLPHKPEEHKDLSQADSHTHLFAVAGK